MSRLKLNTATEVVSLSYWVFAIWWTLILGIHVVTCAYNALYAYCYWELQYTFLNLYLDSFQIGMPPPYHHTIAIVHGIMSALHAVCILLMLGGSIQQQALAFTPWASCDADAKHDEMKSDRTSSVILHSFTKVYEKIVDRHGFCGVNGGHFHAVHVCREVVETTSQILQAYRMSLLLPRTLLNRFYVILLVVNCWSSVIVYSFSCKRDEAHRRFACIVLDCVLDFIACMGVELIILVSYVGEYDSNIHGFPEIIWYNDGWLARALNEFKMVVMVSWSDLASRAIFSLGLAITTINMKELLLRLPPKGNRVTQFVDTNKKPDDRTASDKCWASRLEAVSPMTPPSIPESSKRSLQAKSSKSRHTRGKMLMFRAAHVLFGLWGIVVLGYHIQASTQPILPQCLMQVRPWFVTRTSCYLVGRDCYTLGINGKKDEVEEVE